MSASLIHAMIILAAAAPMIGTRGGKEDLEREGRREENEKGDGENRKTQTIRAGSRERDLHLY